MDNENALLNLVDATVLLWIVGGSVLLTYGIALVASWITILLRGAARKKQHVERAIYTTWLLGLMAPLIASSAALVIQWLQGELESWPTVFYVVVSCVSFLCVVFLGVKKAALPKAQTR